MAHMAEIEIPIFGLDVGQLAANAAGVLESWGFAEGTKEPWRTPTI